MVYGKNYKGEKYRGKVAQEYKIESTLPDDFLYVVPLGLLS